MQLTSQKLDTYSCHYSCGIVQCPEKFAPSFPSIDFSNISSFYYSLKTSLSGPSELSKRLQPLIGTANLSSEKLDTIVEAFKSEEFYKVKPLIAKIIEQQSSGQSNAVLKAIFKAHAFDDAQP